MFMLQHNHDTSIKTFAKTLTDKFKQMTHLYANPEIDRVQMQDFKVSIAESSMMEDYEKLLKELGNSTDDAKLFFPKIVLAKSNQINASSYGLTQLKFAQKEVIELVNVDNAEDTVNLSGSWHQFDIPVQIAIFTRTSNANKELCLELLRILFSSRKVNYSLRLFDDTNPDLVYQLDDFGTITIKDFENKDFMSEKVGESNTVELRVLTFVMTEEYFKLSDDELYETASIATDVQ